MQAVVMILMLSSSVGLAESVDLKETGIISVNRVLSTPLELGPAQRLLGGEPVKFVAQQAYSKWSVLFDKAISIATVELETCPDVKQFDDGVELYIDFDQARLYADGGRSKLVFKFKKALSAESLTFGFLESRGLCIQNLRIFSALDNLKADPLKFNIESTHSPENRQSDSIEHVQALGFGDILDRELREFRSDDREDVWRFRIRSDGTFFARVFIDPASKPKSVRVARAWSAFGQWTLDESLQKGNGQKEKNSLKLKFTGDRVSGPTPLDSLPCGRTCFEARRSDKGRGPAMSDENVQLQVEIQRDGRASFFVRNRSNMRNSNLDFRDLKVRLHSLYN